MKKKFIFILVIAIFLSLYSYTQARIYNPGGSTGGSGTPGGSSTHVQYNDGGSFAGNANLVWMNSTARLGIGTSSPYAKLSVAGQVVGEYFTATSTIATSTFAGALGIGTTSPWGNLSVSATSLSNNPAFVISTSTASATSTAFIVDANGYVGIGTASPANKFNVKNGATNIISVNDNGNVTIGTEIGGITVPLFVNGIARANSLIGPLSSNFNGVGTSNFSIATGGNGTEPARATTFPLLSLPGSSALYYRNAVGGSAATVLTAGDNFAQMVFGKYGATEATSGNHPILSNLAIRPIDITAGSATVENTASLYIEDSASTTVSSVGNYALWVDNGISRFDGNVGIGTTSPWRTLSVTGTVAIDGLTTGAGGSVCLNETTKELYLNAGLTTCGVSSLKYKTDIQKLTIGIDTVMKLNPVSYTSTIDGTKNIGLIAEDVFKVIPELVATEKDGTPRGVKYENLAGGLLVKAIQEQQKKIEDLESRIKLLEAKLK